MTWAKFDDGYDEETEGLSDRAYRLFTNAIIYSRRRDLGGVLDLDAQTSLCRRWKASGRHVDELCSGEPEEALWVRRGAEMVIRSYEKYNPLTSTERVKKHRTHIKEEERARNAAERRGNVSTAFQEHSLAGASATGLETISSLGSNPEPGPEPVLTPPLIPPTTQDAVENGGQRPQRRLERPHQGYRGGELTPLLGSLPKVVR